jgi:hypothetical protein
VASKIRAHSRPVFEVAVVGGREPPPNLIDLLPFRCRQLVIVLKDRVAIVRKATQEVEQARLDVFVDFKRHGFHVRWLQIDSDG